MVRILATMMTQDIDKHVSFILSPFFILSPYFSTVSRFTYVLITKILSAIICKICRDCKET